MKDPIILNGVSLDELFETFYNAAKKAIREESERKPQKEKLNAQEAADLLRIAKPTVYAYARDRVIPSYREGKRLFFKRSELVAQDPILSGQGDRQPTNAELERLAQQHVQNTPLNLAS
ncbi:helix-turn-helix domain-containing protein [Xanthovirga aplysinae]|uniref:helix-turn-helix domain-containing protein n=1 Tax=Xanthovirga aplysinae TaxID=2529853 RepID=UPI0012BB8C64|nr:helix-turn-helix domain-containing protein [Xanthovirga aplysinae]MTI30205.1 DNA-binding protein [Xanthovirga aplysinae]